MQIGAPALAAAYALGRVGCFLVNDDYGRPTSVSPGVSSSPAGLPPSTAGNLQQQFGIPVPPGIDPNTVLAVHPTQLYEVRDHAPRLRDAVAAPDPGQSDRLAVRLYLVLAGAERFLVEILRAKDDRFLGRSPWRNSQRAPDAHRKWTHGFVEERDEPTAGGLSVAWKERPTGQEIDSRITHCPQRLMISGLGTVKSLNRS